MANRVVLATSRSHDYDFFMPISVLVWRHVVGFEALALLTETPEEWKTHAGKVVTDALTEIKADFHYVGHVDGYETRNVGQACRQHACALPVDGDDWLFTADVDLWPTTRDWYHQHETAGKDVAIYYANAYHYKYFCTSCVGMRAKTWREVMKIEPTGQVAPHLQRSYDVELGREPESWSAWNFDEIYLMSRLKAWDGFPSRCLFVDRPGSGPPTDRIDRSAWPQEPKIYGMVDSHLLRPGAVHDNWVRLRPLLAQLIPQHMGWVDSYLVRYRVGRYRS